LLVQVSDLNQQLGGIKILPVTNHNSEEKVRPFRLVKYFTIASLIAIFMGAVVLSVLNTHLARNMLVKKSEDYALLLVENLNHQVFLQFIIPIALKFGKIQLRNKEQSERMDKVVRTTLHSFNVEMVNIYDMNHIISYSFDQEKVGKKNMGGVGYQMAISGKSTSRVIVQPGYEKEKEEKLSFFKKLSFFPPKVLPLLGFPQKSRIVTFAPLRAEKPLSRISGPVLGVVEIVQDMSEDYKAIFRFQIRIIVTCSVVMGILLIVLIFVVKRGEWIIERRNKERIRLKEQLSRAERLSSLGEMVAGISHEIRNPLGIIRSSAELLKKKMSVDDRSKPIVNIIIEEATRLNNIVCDFLNYARPRKPNAVPCHIKHIIEKNISFLQSQFDERGYVIEERYDDNIPEIMADAEMLYQAFLNILLNAMQAMPGGGKIGVDVSLSDTNMVLISFTDEGDGIPEEVMGKIWDPFFTTKDMGTGLGLGIVKNIIEAHNGNVRVSNREFGGTIVTVELGISKL